MKKSRASQRAPAPFEEPLPFPAKGGESDAPREYVYSFELTHAYPNVRSFILKKPLTKSMADTFVELVGFGKKRPAV